MCKRLIILLLLCVCEWACAQAPALAEVRDPTTPLGHRASVNLVTGNGALELHSVLISARRRLAIINGITVREGEEIPGSNGITVRHILPQKVVVQQDEKIWALNLSPGIVKKH